MAKTVVAACAIFIIGIATPALAQLLGDVNCNGYPWEIADAVLMARLHVEHCDLFAPPCWENSDFDQDGQAPTVGDMIYMVFFNDPPNYPRHPHSDTLGVESAIAHPGETLTLPVWISTVDTLMAFQFLLETDVNYLEFDTLIASGNFQLLSSNCDGDIYSITPSPLFDEQVIDQPGNYHICDLILTVNPDINQPVITPLLFSSNPPLALFSGFANSAFFLPVMVDAEIEILPLTDIESAEDPVPTDFSITSYPNPFNDAVNISVFSDHAAEISVYDIMGRPVKRFTANAGNSLIKWDATDESGRALSAGIYFIGEGQTRSFKKVLYLK
ncbi:MAG: T9SS type A sorting domain-containing protein [Candidatus Zixiibacteriota bacterium]|nr:MAG: T9SS type A sorting domain-containing protein [candidate division Zixibacteria bacterium]